MSLTRLPTLTLSLSAMARGVVVKISLGDGKLRARLLELLVAPVVVVPERKVGIGQRRLKLQRAVHSSLRH